MALARMLQEQERAYYLMQFGGVDPTGQASEQQPQQQGRDSDSFQDGIAGEGVVGGGSSDMDMDIPMDDAAEDARGADAEEDESLALARALMAEEQREWNARMLAMAGKSK